MILPLIPASMEGSILELVIFSGFLYWLCPSFINSLLERIARMVDIVTSRMIESFNRFSPNQGPQTESLSTISNMKRFSRDQRYKKAISREADIKNRENQLFDLKENAPDVQLQKPMYMLRLACQNCSLSSRESLVNKTNERMSLRNMFTRHVPKYGLISKYFSDIYYNWRINKLSYDLVPDKVVLEDERITAAIERMTREQFDDSREKTETLYEKLMENNKRRAVKLLNDLKSALNDYVLRCSNWFFHKMFPLFLNSVLVHPGQIAMIKEASKTGLPLIFLPLHRSHLDYLLLTYISYNIGIKAPLVAAGDNLRLPFFGRVLRGLGAFYIKRRIDPIEGRKDHIYKAILHTYMNHSLKLGNNIEFYIEGGRTRSGKPLMPKYGVFSVIVDSLMDGTIDDVLLVPVSMNYDKLVEGNFAREQLGEPKKMENVIDTIKSLWKSINGDYGMVKVDFNQPCSLRELVRTFGNEHIESPQRNKLSSTVSTTSIYGTVVACDTNKKMVENISRHIVYDACQSMSVMATNAVAFLLLTKFRKGALIEELASALDNLRRDLDYSRKELSFQGNSIDVINYAVDMLGPNLVHREKVGAKERIIPNVELPNSIELSYYGNTLVPHYAVTSIIGLAINAINTKHGIVDCDELTEATMELCDILQYEFIFCKPCQSIEQTIQYYIDDLVARKQVFITTNDNILESKSRNIAKQFEDEDDEAFVSIKYHLNDDPNTKELLEYYQAIVLPLVECYTISAQTLQKMGESMLETELIKEVLDNLRMQLMNKSVIYSEAISTDTIKNAIKLFVARGILDCHNEGKLRLYSFKDGHDARETIEELYKSIGKFRPTLM